MKANRNPSSQWRVFLSSTARDLEAYRKIASQVVFNLHFDRIIMEDFEAGSARPPLEECLARVRETADILVVIVAKRYGWAPSDDWPDLPEEQQSKSITWLECLEAQRKGILLIPLILDDSCDWPDEHIEHARAAQLKEFRTWIDRHFVAKRFKSPDSFRDELTRALDRAKIDAVQAGDPALYLDRIIEQCSRTLVTPGGRASWDQIYVPLSAGQFGKAKPLESFLSSGHLLVTGGPGFGKSTFVAKYARDLATNWREGRGTRFPVLLPGNEFWNHVLGYSQRNETGSPVSLTSPNWVSHFLSTMSQDHELGLTASFFDRLLDQGACALILDGFDQADPPRTAPLIAQIAKTYPKCQIIVTSRPWAVIDPIELDAFTHINIAPLDNRTIRTLLLKWSSLANPRPDQAQRRANALYAAINRSETGRQLGRNPLMLNAIAMQGEGSTDLPSSRARLYEEIIGRLLKGIEDPYKKSKYEPLEALQELAWSMQASATPRIDATKRWAGQQVLTSMPGISPLGAVKELELLSEKTGILSTDQSNIRFWHPTIQEFLAARRLAYIPAAARLRIISNEIERLTGEAWRQVLLFLGQLIQDEPQEAEDLFAHLIEKCETASSSELRARYTMAAAALARELGTMPPNLRDRYTELLRSFQSLFVCGDLKGIDMSARLELSRALDTDCAATMEMAWVEMPAGEFWMGAQNSSPLEPRYDRDSLASEGPVRRVSLEGYSMSRFPVTVAQYAAFRNEHGYDRPEFWQSGGFGKWSSPLRWDEQEQYGNQPVTGVSWYEAMAFCAWAQCALPTEAEWERGAAGPNSRRFPWGDDLPDHSFANFDGRFGGITPVGLFPEHASEEGLHELSGNVWEWARDGYGPYAPSGEPVRNPDGWPESPKKVLRGGCYQNGWRFLRTSGRIHSAPEQRYTNFGNTGFRCVRRR